MGILRDFERRLEGAVEGLFARADALSAELAIQLADAPRGAIARQAILAHDGSIDITCPPGGGTVVRFVVPTQRPSA